MKTAFLDELRKAHKLFHGTVVAQAQKIEVDGDRIVFAFGPHQKALRSTLDGSRTALEEIASRLAGRRIIVVSAEGITAPAAADAVSAPASDRKAELKQQALEDSGVQAMLDVFAAEIRDVEER